MFKCLNYDKSKVTFFSICLLTAFEEALFLLVAPFFPELMASKGIPELFYGPMFV